MTLDLGARRIIVTGGAGFIGSALVRRVLSQAPDSHLLVIDKLTYASTRASLASVEACANFRFLRADIADAPAMARVFHDFRPDLVFHLAAETHVDRSLEGPQEFIQSNIVGTAVMLEAARAYCETLGPQRGTFRFLHISTDEVFGALGKTGKFSEDSPYRPSSPYSASKAASDHLARAWFHSYGLPVIVTNCSNNYGPCQFPEKLIPRMILSALEEGVLPVYGDGSNIRDWLHVDDHAAALVAAALRGVPGETYCVGTENEVANIDIVKRIVATLDRLRPSPLGPRERLIRFVTDRPGHDWRYAIDPGKAARDLGWQPRIAFSEGLEQTILWYLDNPDWVAAARAQAAAKGVSEKRYVELTAGH